VKVIGTGEAIQAMKRVLSVTICLLVVTTSVSMPFSYGSQDVDSSERGIGYLPHEISSDIDIISKSTRTNSYGHGEVDISSRSTEGPQPLGTGTSYIFYDDFETGTDGWTIADADANNGADYWAATTDRPCYDSNSLYCAGVGGTTGSHTVYYDTAEYAEQRDGWTTGDYNVADGEDYWSGSTDRSSPASPTNSYYCSAVGSVLSLADMESGQNTTDAAIPDNGAGWGYSIINITGAPTGSIVTSVDVHFLLPHTYVSDIYIDISNSDASISHVLWDQNGVVTDNGDDDDPEDDADIDITRTGIADFNDEPVNQEWGFWAWDYFAGDTGYIDECWIKIYYTNPDQHYDDSMDAYMKKEVDLTGQTGCALEYHYWLDIEDGYDYAYVKMATTDYADPNNAGWTTIDSMSDNYDSSDYDDAWHSVWWTSGALDISAFDGQVVYLLFHFHSDGLTLREGWYIDNIEITGTSNMYDDYMDSYADVTVDLTGYSNAYVACVFWMDAEDFYDVFSISVNRGAGWRTLMLLNDGADEYQYDSYDPDLYARIWWDTGHLDLTPECGFSNVQIRLWFSSDSSTTREGVYVDEFQVASVFFFDDMESGTNGWTSTHAVEPNWHLVTTDYYSFDHSWWCGLDGTGEYDNGMDEYLTHDFDLTYADEAALQFSFTGFAEQDYDFLFIGISVDNGTNWDYYGGFTGDYSDGWYMAEIDLSGYTRHQALVTFDFYSDKVTTEAGYWIDDVNIFGTIDKTPPAQVTGLTVSTPPEGNTLNIQWTANTEFDISGYYVYRSLVSGSSYVLVATTQINSFVDTGLTDGVTYYYVVSAFDVAGNEGLQSSEASGIPADATPPPAIPAVYAEDLGIGGLVNVSWEPCLEPDVSGYKVYFDTLNFDDITLATYHLGSPIDDPSATWCHVAGLTNDIQYYFGVTAIDKSSNENTSIVKTAIATPTDITPPEVIIDAPLEGSDVSGDTSIIVYSADDCGILAVFVSIDKGPPQQCTQTVFGWEYLWDTTLETDGPHMIDANATDNNGNIGYSSTVNVNVDNSPPEPPSNLQISLSGNDIVLSWDASPSPDISHYAVYRSLTPTMNYATPEDTTALLTWTDFGAGDNDWQNYFYVARAVNLFGTEETNEVKVAKVVRQVQDGWNLISIPVDMADESIDTVLQTITWERARYYDATDPADPWKGNIAGRPASYNDLLTTDHMHALWVFVNAPGGDYLISVGDVPSSTVINLYTGWNFVGYPGFTEQTVATALSGIPYDRVEAYDGGAAYYISEMGGSDTMSYGNGYWIKVTSDCIWTITN